MQMIQGLDDLHQVEETVIQSERFNTKVLVEGYASYKLQLVVDVDIILEVAKVLDDELMVDHR